MVYVWLYIALILVLGKGTDGNDHGYGIMEEITSIDNVEEELKQRGQQQEASNIHYIRTEQ